MGLLGKGGWDVRGFERRALADRLGHIGSGREALAQASASAGDARADGPDRDGERVADLLVAQIGPDEQEKRVAAAASSSVHS